MIVGTGSIAKVLTDRDDVTFFASGVSDSSCINYEKFNRERNLLLSQPKNKHIVYFSSIGIYTGQNTYIQHKRDMESLIKDQFVSYTIVRIECIEWGKAPNTIQNYFRRMINENKPVQILNIFRYVVSLEEFLYWMNIIPVGEKNEMNILGTKIHAVDIYNLVRLGKL